MNPEVRETADATRPLSSAVRSMTGWFQRELAEIARAIDYGERHLAAHPDDSVTRASVAELRRQREELCSGWENSSLRRAVESSSAAPAGDGREQRVGLADAPPTTFDVTRAASASSTTTAKSLFGYAANFNKWTTIGGYFKEQIAPGAFTDAIKQSDVRLLFNHDPNHVFGRTTASTLELAEDTVGLRFVCYLLPFDGPSYSLARRIDRRDISGCSFSFAVTEESWKLPSKAGDLDERTIRKIDRLYDVGPVTYPAYPQTSVQATFEKVDSGRAVSPWSHDGDLDSDIPVERPRPGGRAIPAWKQTLLEIELKNIQNELREWRIDHVEEILADIEREKEVQDKRAAHLAVHPEDAGRIDIPGGLLLAGRR